MQEVVVPVGNVGAVEVGVHVCEHLIEAVFTHEGLQPDVVNRDFEGVQIVLKQMNAQDRIRYLVQKDKQSIHFPVYILQSGVYDK